MKLSDFLVPEAMIPNLTSTIRDEALREIVSGLQGAGHLAGQDTGELTAALLEREGLASTAIGRGAAVRRGGQGGEQQQACVERVHRSSGVRRGSVGRG